MLKALLRIEESVARVEGWLLTFLVVLMLALAVYNVFYRNVLVPIQASIVVTDDDSEPVIQEPASRPTPAKSNEPSEGADDGFGGGFDDSETDSDDDGFGGGFGAEEEPEPAEADEGFGGGFGGEEPAEDSNGFGGGFGDDTESKPKLQPKPEDEGFGGGFGSDEPDPKEDEGFGGGFGADDSEPEDDDGFGGGFGDEEAESDTFEPVDVPDPTAIDEAQDAEFSGFELFVVETVDAVKIEWIDVLLRHLVLIVGFLGAMIATRRRKHITVDALSKVLPEKALPFVDVVTQSLAAIICVFLAMAGWDLVSISLEYPKELMSWADEWTFQMVFPIGFLLLTFHFVLRVLEAIAQIVNPDAASTEGEA